MNKWHKSLVATGSGNGKKIGFPTVNLDPAVMSSISLKGVYSCCVKYDRRIYKGVLYFGPRLVLNETHDVVEIFIKNFSGDIYGRYIEFKTGKFIRKPKDFDGLDELKEQLKKDIKEAD